MVIFWLLTHIIHFFYWYHHFVPFPSGMYVYIYIYYIYIFFFFGGGYQHVLVGQEVATAWGRKFPTFVGLWLNWIYVRGAELDFSGSTVWHVGGIYVGDLMGSLPFFWGAWKGNKLGQSNDVAVPTLTFIQVDEWMMDRIWVWFIDFFAQLGSLFDFVRWLECCFIFLFFGFFAFFFLGFYKTVSDSQLDGNWWLKSCQTPVVEWMAN